MQNSTTYDCCTSNEFAGSSIFLSERRFFKKGKNSWGENSYIQKTYKKNQHTNYYGHIPACWSLRCGDVNQGRTTSTWPHPITKEGSPFCGEFCEDSIIKPFNNCNNISYTSNAVFGWSNVLLKGGFWAAAAAIKRSSCLQPGFGNSKT